MYIEMYGDIALKWAANKHSIYIKRLSTVYISHFDIGQIIEFCNHLILMVNIFAKTGNDSYEEEFFEIFDYWKFKFEILTNFEQNWPAFDKLVLPIETVIDWIKLTEMSSGVNQDAYFQDSEQNNYSDGLGLFNLCLCATDAIAPLVNKQFVERANQSFSAIIANADEVEYRSSIGEVGHWSFFLDKDAVASFRKIHAAVNQQLLTALNIQRLISSAERQQKQQSNPIGALRAMMEMYRDAA